MSDEQFREDELVSAYLDGEATPAEIAEVEQNNALMARVEQLRSVRDAVAAPVAPMPAERREQMISAALAAADAETVQRRESRIVPVHRRRETLLAVAAAAILLAAVVSAGLIASRGGDESAEMAAEAPAADADVEDTAPASTEADMAMAEEAAPMPEEEPMAEEAAIAATTTAAYVETAEEAAIAGSEAAMDAAETAEEAAIAGSEAAMDAAETAEEASIAELEAAMAAAEAESAMEAPAEETADAPTVSADEADQEDEGRRTADEAAVPVVDLGVFESLQSLLDNIAARWSAALEDGIVTDSGMCSSAVHERELELDVEAARPFIATVGSEDPVVFDGRFARQADGTGVIIYAAPPNCETGIYEQDESDGS